MTDLGGDGAPARTSSTQSRELGAELRQVRTAAGHRASRLAEELGWSQAKLSKLEKGWRGASAWDVATLLGKLGTDKPTRDRIMHLAQEPQLGHFARPHQSGFPDALLCLDIHESAATTLTCFEPMLIPALLQVPAYTSALLTPLADSPDMLNSMVQRRVDRQAVLRGPNAPESVFYIHEAALDLQVGDQATMRDQMKWLAVLCDLDRMSPRIIPMAAGGHAALRCPATLLTFAKYLTPLSYADTDVAMVFFDDSKAINLYRRKFAALDSLALDSLRSRDLFEQRA